MAGHDTVAEGASSQYQQRQRMKLRVPGRPQLDVIGYCDAGAQFERSGILDHAVDRLNLKDNVIRYQSYDKWNTRYLRCLHHICSRSAREGLLDESKWRHLHKIVVRFTDFKEETYTDICLGHSLDGLPLYSRGRLPSEYRFVNQNPSPNDDKDNLWAARELEVIVTQKQDRKRNIRIAGFDLLIVEQHIPARVMEVGLKNRREG